MDGAELDSLPTNLPICRAAGDGSLNELKLLIARGASLSQADQHGNTPLFHAVWAGQQACVEQLLLRMTKYEVNARNLDGNTALSFAVARKHVSLMEKLIQYGADITIKNNDGESPQDYVRNSKAFKSNQFVLRLFALAGSKFIGAQFLKAMKHPSAAPTTETKTTDATHHVTAGYFDFKAMAKESEPFADLATVFDVLTTGDRKDAVPVQMRVLKPEHLRRVFNDFLGMNLRDKQLQAVLDQIDINDDGKVVLQDLWKSTRTSAATEFDPDFSFAVPFAAFDSDGDGLITTNDLQKAHAKLGKLLFADNDAEMHHIVQRVTGDFDTKDMRKVGISFQQFHRIVSGQGLGAGTAADKRNAAAAAASSSAGAGPSSAPPSGPSSPMPGERRASSLWQQQQQPPLLSSGARGSIIGGAGASAASSAAPSAAATPRQASEDGVSAPTPRRQSSSRQLQQQQSFAYRTPHPPPFSGRPPGPLSQKSFRMVRGSGTPSAPATPASGAGDGRIR